MHLLGWKNEANTEVPKSLLWTVSEGHHMVIAGPVEENEKTAFWLDLCQYFAA